MKKKPKKFNKPTGVEFKLKELELDFTEKYLNCVKDWQINLFDEVTDDNPKDFEAYMNEIKRIGLIIKSTKLQVETLKKELRNFKKLINSPLRHSKKKFRK